MKNLISISGYSGSGKDTVGEMIKNHHILKYGKIYEIKKFAEKPKQILETLFGIKHFDSVKDQECPDSYWVLRQGGTEKLFKSKDKALDVAQKVGGKYTIGKRTYREILIDFASGFGRERVHPDIWVNLLLEDYDDDLWIVTDTRFRNEYDALKELGALMVWVDRDVPVERMEVEGLAFDLKIKNNGTKYDLAKKLDEII